MVLPGHADAQSTASGERDRAKTSYRFSYTLIYQFETDLDSGGNFDVRRHFLLEASIQHEQPRWLRIGDETK